MAGGHSLNLAQGPGPRVRRHPSRIRDGQVFAPLHGRHHRRACVRAVEGEWARVVREGGGEGRLSIDRLLAVTPDGEGIHYRFCGWHPRPRGYRAELRVLRLLPVERSCVLGLPEWDPDAEIEQPLAILPEELRSPGAVGSCLANLAAPSAARLAIHSCRPVILKVGSPRVGLQHPDVLVAGQRYRRHADGAVFRLIEDTPRGARAWNGARVVRLGRARLLANGRDGHGRHYEYLGGGVREMRRRRRAGPR